MAEGNQPPLILVPTLGRCNNAGAMREYPRVYVALESLPTKRLRVHHNGGACRDSDSIRW